MVTFSFAGKTLYGNTGGSASTGAWLNYLPEEKLALAYTTNAKPYPVKDIVAGVFDIYWNRPYQIPVFETFEVSPEILDRYVGVYSVPGAANKVNITRTGATLYFQPGSEKTGVALEATAVNKFKTGPVLVFEFDAEKGEMILYRGDRKLVFKKQ
jgi:CubicO group peptidase (beta-lactamase class C family)